MKNRTGYILAAAAVVGVSFLVLSKVGSEPVETTCMVAKAETVVQTIQCDGKVEEAGQMEITLGKTVIPEKVFVKEGDKVWKGLNLMQYIEPSLIDSIGGIEGIDGDVLEALGVLGGNGALKEYSEGLTPEKLKQLSSPQSKVLTSPTSGVITKVLAQPNAKSGANDTVMVIATSERLQVKLKVPETQVSDLAIGQKVMITGVGFKESTYAGVVTDIEDRAQTNALSTDTTPMVTVYVTVLGQGNDIKPGFSAKARIQTGEKSETIVVPYEAVNADNSGREYVYVLKGEVAKKTYIETDMELADGFEVVDGLKDGDQVILDCSSISNGKRVRPVFDSGTISEVKNENNE